MNKTKRTGIFFPQFAETGVQIISDFVNIEIPEKVNMPKNLFHVHFTIHLKKVSKCFFNVIGIRRALCMWSSG